MAGVDRDCRITGDDMQIFDGKGNDIVEEKFGILCPVNPSISCHFAGDQPYCQINCGIGFALGLHERKLDTVGGKYGFDGCVDSVFDDDMGIEFGVAVCEVANFDIAAVQSLPFVEGVVQSESEDVVFQRNIDLSGGDGRYIGMKMNFSIVCRCESLQSLRIEVDRAIFIECYLSFQIVEDIAFCGDFRVDPGFDRFRWRDIVDQCFDGRCRFGVDFESDDVADMREGKVPVDVECMVASIPLPGF